MPYVRADDGADIYYREWGTGGSPVLLSHGWPLNGDAWEATARFLATRGHRVVTHDRRGHGRSTRTWQGNEMDTYADDLHCLVEALDLHDLTLVGHSTGGGEIVHYVGRHGSRRVARLVLVAAVPPMMLATDDNPEGLPGSTFDELRAGEAADRAQLYRDLADGPFFGHNRRGDVSQGLRDAFWAQGMACGHQAAYECIAAFSATDFRADLAAIDVPTLVIHGDDDQIVPFEVGGARTAAMVPGARLEIYEGSGHALPDTDRDRLHADLLAFIDG